MARSSCVCQPAPSARMTSGWICVGWAEPLAQAFLMKLVHQKADRAAMHAVDRLARGHELVQGLQHEAVAAERDDDVGARRIGIAVAADQRGTRLLGLGYRAGHEGDVLEAGKGTAHQGARTDQWPRPAAER